MVLMSLPYQDGHWLEIFERFQSVKSHSNEIYLSVGYVPIDEMKFVFDVIILTLPAYH